MKWTIFGTAICFSNVNGFFHSINIVKTQRNLQKYIHRIPSNALFAGAFCAFVCQSFTIDSGMSILTTVFSFTQDMNIILFCQTEKPKNEMLNSRFDLIGPLKSVHFKKTVVRISFLSKLWYFQYKSKQKVPHFKRKEIRTTVFLK